MRRLDARSTRPRSPRASAFTLVELLVVIAIIGALVALLLPAIQAARESARRSQCANNLHQIGIGMINFHDSKTHFPAGEWKPAGVPPKGALAWCAWFLPYIEQQNLHSLMDFKADMRKPPNWRADLTGPTNTVVPTYLCPSAANHQNRRNIDVGRLTDFNNNGVYDVGTGEGLAAIDYLGMRGPGIEVDNFVTGSDYGDNRGILLSMESGPPCFGPSQECFAKTIAIRNVTDGTSHSIIVAECSGRGIEDYNGDLPGGESTDKLDGAWASSSNIGRIEYPVNPTPTINWREEEIFSDHPGGAHVLMCDGSVHFLREETELRVLFALCSRNGEETVDVDF
jgi:prepilin-type N-terminal cleavage/methylation domain-containing protein/prepilin-type processing-associated H-X9-DG protein